MARQILPIAGAVIGSFFGAPQIGYAIGSIIGNAVDPQVIKGPKLGDAGLQTSAEGVFRPIVRGVAAVKGNVIDRGNRQIRKDRQQAGKGGGPVTETERVFWTFAIRICEGPIAGVLRIWQDEKLVYDVRPGSTMLAESEEYAGAFRLYLGDEEQLPDPGLEVIHGIGNTPAYRGTAYIVFQDFDLTDYRERIPDFRFEVASAADVVLPTAAMAVWVPGGGSFSEVYTAPDGQTWSTTRLPIGAVAGTIGSGPDGFVVDGVSNSRYTVDDGVTWHDAVGRCGGNPVYGNGRYIGQGGPLGLLSSVAIGGPYVSTIIPGMGSSSNAVAADDFFFYVTIDSQRRVAWSDRVEGPWNISDSYDIAPTGLASPMAAFNGEIRRAGHPTLTVIRSTDRTSFVPMALPTIPGATAFTYMHYSVTLGVWLLGTDNGRIVVDDGDGWVLTDVDLGGYVNGIASNGSVAIASSRNTSTNVSRIASSANGYAWTIDKTANLIAGVAARTPASAHPIGAKIPLSTLVSELHERAGHTAADFDVSELDDLVTGVVWAGDYTCADAVRAFMPIYFFDAGEFDRGSGYRANYVKRGKPVALVVTDDDLIAAPERTVREDALERPKTLHLHFENPITAYAPAKASVSRNSQDVHVVGERTFQVPVVYDNVDEPRQTADKLLRIAWVEVAGEEEFTLGDNFLELAPTDCIGLSLRGLVRRLRITQEMIDAGAQTYRMLADRQSAYTSNITGIPLPEPTPPPPSIIGPTVFEFLDIPALNDTNDRLLYYVAASGQTEAWFGALVQRQLPPDTAWTDATTFRQNTIMGTLLDPVASASEFYTDTTNVVRVQLYSDDQIEALTNLQFLSEGGAFALEKPDGTWEVMQYRDAEETSDGVFELSHLARGRLNSGTGVHDAGGRFVLLDAVRSVDAVTSWIGRDLTHRAVSLGTSPDGATTVTGPYIGRSQIEFPVAHLFLERDLDTINATTIPRHRFGTEDSPVRSINWLAYRWVITDGVNSATVDAIEDTRNFDVTGWGSPITVTVAQINRLTGAGPTVSEVIA